MDLFAPLSFKRGRPMPNRLALAPLTNTQSHDDGTLSSQEHRWLTMRAEGGFGLVMTAAAFVQPEGKGFPGQLGIASDAHLPGLTKLAEAIKAEGSLAVAQLYHSGQRTTRELSGHEVLAPSDDTDTQARAMTAPEVEAMIEAFIAAAVRAERAGFDGAEIHGAHTYLLCSFLSPQFNRRTDQYGGSLENRARPIRAIIAGVRERCGPDFILGLRLSVERMGMETSEIRTLVQELLREDQLDFIDLSLWDVFKEPEEDAFKSRPLIDWFTDLDRGETRLGVAGHIRSAAEARAALEAGADFTFLGLAAIAHHDFPRQAKAQAAFEMQETPVSPAHLATQGVSPAFIEYLRTTRPDFIEAAPLPEEEALAR